MRKTFLLCLLMCTFCIPGGYGTPNYPACETGEFDVNGCGDQFEHRPECVWVAGDSGDHGCCLTWNGEVQTQHWAKAWYDCTGDGEADCEDYLLTYYKDSTCN